MSSDFNPYEVPKAEEKKPKKFKQAKSQKLADFDEQAQDRIVYWAKALRPWITFFGSLLYVYAVLWMILGLVAGVTSASLSGGRSMGAYTGSLVFTVVNLAVGVLHIGIGGLLFRFRDSLDCIRDREGLLDSVADAFERLTSFWSFVGKVTIVVLVLFGTSIAGRVLLAFSR
jgi:hypothetical protein